MPVLIEKPTEIPVPGGKVTIASGVPADTRAGRSVSVSGSETETVCGYGRQFRHSNLGARSNAVVLNGGSLMVHLRLL